MISYLKIFVATFIFITSCTNNVKKTSDNFKGIPKVDFCDLAKYSGQQVYIKCIYKGNQEYWSLSPIEKECSENMNVALEFNNPNFDVPTKYEKIFNMGVPLIIEAIGKYETGNNNGYGHLGLHTSHFIISELLVAKAYSL
jgi:hypothetical protein